MDMNKASFLKQEIYKPQWYVIDAKDQVLGRLATKAATILRGKHKPSFTPHATCGDYVVVINCDKVKLTGNKWTNKEYETFSGWMSGRKITTAKELAVKHPADIITLAVRGMIPKTKQGRQIMKRLRVYVGNEHPHIAQFSTTDNV